MSDGTLRRELGLGGAIMMGLGSIVGTGAFVAIGVAAGIAGPAVVAAIAIAAVVATANGLSSAQLAACHPVSGGTYEYGYRFTSPLAGFAAGWMFLAAKSASAATAALGLAGYLLAAGGGSSDAQVPLALGMVAAITLLVSGGLRRSNLANTLIVGTTLLTLAFFVISGLPVALRAEPGFAFELSATGWRELLHASALMFVAYTGYGRIATMGEEVREPGRTIPRAIIATLLVSMALYLAVGAVAVAAVGASAFAAAAEGGAPLERVARRFAWPGASWVLTLGAITAMAGVLLNLILGLSRVLLAMGRRGDVPRRLGRLSPSGDSPTAAVLTVGAIVAGLTALGSVRTTWSFSAFTVLIYYALTHVAALRLPAEHRRFPRAISVFGLLACLGLAAFVEPPIWGAGLALLAVGAVWHAVARRLGFGQASRA